MRNENYSNEEYAKDLKKLGDCMGGPFVLILVLAPFIPPLIAIWLACHFIAKFW